MNAAVPQLLVSVRTASEAEAALAGGADVIDVKEPSRGALGRADDAVVDEIRRVIADRRPVSAALGELIDFTGAAPDGVAYVKCGLAGFAKDAAWSLHWSRFREATAPALAVVVAYADWQCAQAPPLDEVVAFALRQSGAILLVDTCCKDKNIQGRRATLFDWLPLPWIATLIRDVHEANGRIALAGSLGLGEIEQLRDLQPDWIAVRGAACEASDRGATIDRERVRRIKSLLRGESES